MERRFALFNDINVEGVVNPAIIADITEGRKIKKKIVRRDNQFDKLKKLVRDYADFTIIEWFKDNKELLNDFEYLIENGDDDEKINEEAQEQFRDNYIEKNFNNWETGNSFFADSNEEIGDFKVPHFIRFWKDATEWYKDGFDTDLVMKDTEDAWNKIAYWVLNDKLYDEYEEVFTERYKKNYFEYKDVKTRTSRIPCGVCYENPILFTGCWTCNNNYVCYKCYIQLGEEDEKNCPFCRKQMIIQDELEFRQTADDGYLFRMWLEKIREVNAIIPQIFANPVMETCGFCRKDLRWKDKTKLVREEIDYAGDDTYIYNDVITCIPCYKKWVKTEEWNNKKKEMIEKAVAEYKNIDDAIPQSQDFQDWIYKLRPTINLLKDIVRCSLPISINPRIVIRTQERLRNIN